MSPYTQWLYHLVSSCSYNNNNSPSRRHFENSTFTSGGSSHKSNLISEDKKEANKFSTPDVILQNQSFLDALSAKLNTVGSVKVQENMNAKSQVAVNNGTSKWNSVNTSPDQATHQVNGATNINVNVNSIPKTNKNSIHTEIQRGAFNLRKTNGILFDRSAPKI